MEIRMTAYEYLQMNAFTDQPLGGSSCAVVFDTDEMDVATMLAIAKEINLSRTAFLRQSGNGHFSVRYFTPVKEIVPAGPPTIAATFALVAKGRLELQDSITRLTLELGTSPLDVIDIEIVSQDGVIQRAAVLLKKKPQFLSTHDPADIMPLFGLSPQDVLPDVPIQTVDIYIPQLMIAVRDREVLRRIHVDVGAYSEYRSRSDFLNPHLFCLEGITRKGQTFARHFGPPPDMPEDPFTGSASGAMASFLWHYGLLRAPIFVAEQGYWLQRPGQATLEVVGPPDDIEGVKIGGQAVTLIEGILTI
jgi:trans-2,3-dihydro-3-hydroxyanthranilate isomerase